jgi:hypothetical protein
MVHDRAGSPDRTLRLYEGLYHELLNEPERRIVLGDITTWPRTRQTLRGCTHNIYEWGDEVGWLA